MLLALLQTFFLFVHFAAALTHFLFVFGFEGIDFFLALEDDLLAFGFALFLSVFYDTSGFFLRGRDSGFRHALAFLIAELMSFLQTGLASEHQHHCANDQSDQ